MPTFVSDDVLGMVRTVSDCVAEIIRRYNAGKSIDVRKIKNHFAGENGLKSSPKLVDIIAAMPDEYRKKLAHILTAKPIRSASGIAVVAIMSKPHRCPHIALTGSVCAYCPGGPDSDFEYSTQAYTGYEPASMRAIRNRYDPFKQTRHRVDQLRRLGHAVDKVEFIVMGGTFMSLDQEYRDFFITKLTRRTEWTQQ